MISHKVRSWLLLCEETAAVSLYLARGMTAEVKWRKRWGVLETEGKVLLEHKGYIPFTVSCSTFYFFFFSRVICICISMYQLRGIENFEEQKSTQACYCCSFV